MSIGIRFELDQGEPCILFTPENQIAFHEDCCCLPCVNCAEGYPPTSLEIAIGNIVQPDGGCPDCVYLNSSNWWVGLDLGRTSKYTCFWSYTFTGTLTCDVKYLFAWLTRETLVYTLHAGFFPVSYSLQYPLIEWRTTFPRWSGEVEIWPWCFDWDQLNLPFYSQLWSEGTATECDGNADPVSTCTVTALGTA